MLCSKCFRGFVCNRRFAPLQLLNLYHSSEGKSAKSIRQHFIDYFVCHHGHKHVRSSPVIPFSDPSLAFVNAGMNQFKKVFLGLNPPPCKRAVNSQKCIRVGGKHNDLDIVGKDGYHHTFFEMLGNWSFGDYFKKDACKMAWALLTEVYKIPEQRLYVTYFGGDEKLGLQPDVDTMNIWREIGVPIDRILSFGVKDNFWEMGATGPCGPCTEIHYDHMDRAYAADRVNMGYQDLTELWNIVFIQFDRKEDGSLQHLPHHHVDTGMGLERLTAVLQGVTSNYDTDLFSPLFSGIQKFTKAPPYSGKFEEGTVDEGYRIMADHSRMITVALADGMLPDQNHKLRRIIRKAVATGKKVFSAERGLLHEVTNYVAESLGDSYPEIWKKLDHVKLICDYEEDLMYSLQRNSLKEWEGLIQCVPALRDLDETAIPNIVAGFHELEDSVKSNESFTVSGELAFKLYDTYGLEKEAIMKLAEINNLKVDLDQFHNYLDEVKIISKEASKVENMISSSWLVEFQKQGIKPTDDSLKYNYVRVRSGEYEFPTVECLVQAIIVNNTLVSKVNCDESECSFILNKTCFYHEAGGQVNDIGTIVSHSGEMHVKNVQKVQDYILHIGHLSSGEVRVGDKVTLKIDRCHRTANMCNHTATHLLNAALHQVLTVSCQRSSYVSPKYFTFDFSFYKDSFTQEDVKKVEDMVKECIRRGIVVQRTTVPLSKLLEMEDAVLLPGEIYPEDVHVIQIEGDLVISREPCCGTHVLNTEDIGDFSVLAMKSGGTGVRSIRAVTGCEAKTAKERATFLRNKVLNLGKEIDSFLTKQNSTEENKFEALMQELKREVNDSSIIPLTARYEINEVLNDLSKRLRDDKRVLVRDAIDEEMRSVVETTKTPFIIHCLQASSTNDKLPLKKATNWSSNLPILVLGISEGLVKARCCVPHELADASFNAELWMKPVLEVFRAKGSAPRGQDPSLVYKMKGKKVGTNLDDLMQEATKRAANFAECALLKKSISENR